MSQIIGKLSKITTTGADFEPVFGSVEFALCGYGGNLPRVPNVSSIGDATQVISVPSGSDGTFTTGLIGNDIIEPAGTYYTFTVRDENGDILQVSAHTFVDAQNYDMDNEAGFDPNQPPPAPPFALANMLETVPYSPTPVFDGSVYPSWVIQLTGDAAATFNNLADGNLYTIIIAQDATGGHAFTFPANVENEAVVDREPNSVTIQTFVAVDNILSAIGAGTWDASTGLLTKAKQRTPRAGESYVNRRLQKVRAAQRMILDGSAAETFAIACKYTVTQLSMKHVVPGQLYVFLLTQDGTGDHSFDWGNQLVNGGAVLLDPSGQTIQAYVGLPNDLLFAIMPGTWK